MPEQPDSNAALGTAIRRLRGSTTQEEIGQRMGMPQSYVSRVEAGDIDVKWSTVWRFAEALGVPVAELVATVETINAESPPA